MPSFQEYLHYRNLDRSQFVDSTGTTLQAAARTHFGRKIQFSSEIKQGFIKTKLQFMSDIRNEYGDEMALHLFVRAKMSDDWLTSEKPLRGKDIRRVETALWTKDLRLMDRTRSAVVQRTGRGHTIGSSQLRGMAIRLGLPAFSDSDCAKADSLYMREVSEHPHYYPGITMTTDVLNDIGQRVVAGVHKDREWSKYTALKSFGLVNDVIVYIFQLMAARRR